MKKLLLMFAAVGMLFTACNKETDHNNVKQDHSADIVGTWTCLTENYAEALIINADGSAVSYGIEDGEYWENIRGSVIVDGDNITMNFEDDDNLTGHFDIIPGQAFSLYEDSGERYIYQYCANDLSDEIIGMWVCNDGVAGMSIQTYKEDGKCIYTGFSLGANDYMTNYESTYEVFGDMLFQKTGDRYFATRCTYIPNGNSLGDILSTTSTILVNGEYVTSSYSFLRVKNNLNLADKTYAYNTAYVTNAKGKDEDFAIMGHTFNIAKIKASDFNVMFGADLFLAEFPNSNTMKHRFRIDGQDAGFDASIAVEGNKVSIDMSVVNPALRKVDMYMFQDANDSQLHMYMPTASFINYFANMELYALILEGKIDPANSTAVAKVFTDMEARVESINVSFVFKALK